MAPNRSERQAQLLQNLTTAETLRQASEAPKVAAEAKEESKMPLFWRVFGGTVLSVSSLITMTAYQGFAGGLAECHSELAHLQTDLRKELGLLGGTMEELISQDEFASKVRQLDRSLVDLDDDGKLLTQLKDRCQGLTELYLAGVEQRKQLEAELGRIREQQAAHKERQELRDELTRLRARLAAVEARRVRFHLVPGSPGAE